ncbi:MAG TPA: cysteine desulfurase family protein [Myxococcota bacterium]|nr:cysteine desulfurase family protein [Myxococcota bacterium]
MRVYLDHNATSPVRDEVADAISRALRERWGNPSSVHAEGAAARAAVERARESVAALVGVSPREVVFTSGASEANNTLLFGVAGGPGTAGRHVVTTAVEHPSVDAPLEALEAQGLGVTRVPVDGEGRVDPDAFAAALRETTVLASAIHGHNETGVLQPLEALAACAHARGVAFHADVTQAAGRIPLELTQAHVDFASLSAHKLGGPKGVGCLVARGERAFEPLLRGGPQERGRRGGTENVPGIVGFGVACELALRELPRRAAVWGELRDRLWEGIEAKVPGARRNGGSAHVLPNTLDVCFPGAAGDLLVQALDLEGIAVSSGAACASGSVEPSRALRAYGLCAADARASLRFSLGHGVDAAQIDHVLALLPDLVSRVRAAERA